MNSEHFQPPIYGEDRYRIHTIYKALYFVFSLNSGIGFPEAEIKFRGCWRYNR